MSRYSINKNKISKRFLSKIIILNSKKKKKQKNKKCSYKILAK